MGEQVQQPDLTMEPLDYVHDQIPEMGNLFEGSYGESHNQEGQPAEAQQAHLDYATALCRSRCATNLLKILQGLRRLSFPALFLLKYSGHYIGARTYLRWDRRARPVACGDILRRVISAVFCRRYGRKLADYFQPWGQYGVAVSGGVEIMALTATLGFEEGCTILSYDGANAFNSIYRHRFSARR